MVRSYCFGLCGTQAMFNEFNTFTVNGKDPFASCPSIQNNRLKLNILNVCMNTNF